MVLSLDIGKHLYLSIAKNIQLEAANKQKEPLVSMCALIQLAEGDHLHAFHYVSHKRRILNDKDCFDQATQ